jgi:ABC-type bacteriocin/lantibiotic exporter with double-glycine peptidase domain
MTATRLRFVPPFYAQEKSSSCLPACLRMVLAAYRLKLSERELQRRTGWREQIGTSSTAIVAAARSLGFLDSREVFGLRLHDLRDALRTGIYPIVGIGLEPYGRMGQHAQVVVRVTSRGVSVHDPLLGRLTPNLLTFEAAWQLGDFLTGLIA